MNNKVFISGKITGDKDYEAKFERAEEEVETFAFFDRQGVRAAQRGYLGFVAVNPTKLTLMGKPTACYRWSVCMAVCLWHLVGCTYVYSLRDWKESRGAKVEHRWAKLLGKKIIYQK